jgi:hypothetical protein
VPALAASYAAGRGLPVAALVPDFERFPADAAERRDAELVALADDAVVVWPDRDPGVLRLLRLARAKGIPVHVIGGEPAPRARPVKGVETPPRGLPD